MALPNARDVHLSDKVAKCILINLAPLHSGNSQEAEPSSALHRPTLLDLALIPLSANTREGEQRGTRSSEESMLFTSTLNLRRHSCSCLFSSSLLQLRRALSLLCGGSGGFCSLTISKVFRRRDIGLERLLHVCRKAKPLNCGPFGRINSPAARIRSLAELSTCHLLSLRDLALASLVRLAVTTIISSFPTGRLRCTRALRSPSTPT